MIVDGLWEPFKVPIRPVKRPIAKRYGRFFARGYASRSAAFATLRLAYATRRYRANMYKLR
jgi:hypothetical protein